MKIVIGIVLAVGLVALDALAYIWSGYVLSIIWGWFVTPIFSIPPIGIPAAIGVALAVGLLTHQAGPGGKDRFAIIISYNFVMPLVVLCAGWIAKGYL